MENFPRGFISCDARFSNCLYIFYTSRRKSRMVNLVFCGQEIDNPGVRTDK